MPAAFAQTVTVREATSMRRHGPIEHTPRRRWIPLLKPKRCTCGDELPCYIGTMLARLPFFDRSARPTWDAPTTIQRPLMTPGQAHRSSQGGRW
ncbi:hypothetical protein [Actinoplanes sp. M2I2]|uniref:hypothetical protein n=1 Tax=Actinoplanes sp. M2I2 TaxID=1734444 RepID=UPI002020DA46|nr:hypothetical protein [Actinoplanes sp. M2I2]